ncbi:MAG: hypothetical protein FJ102_11705 [Deltaproteobacteria bacterium]|nr:hypothetical protein [Deltaproteobacteria bacterium]
MKLFLWLVVILLLGGSIYVAAAHFSGGAFPTPGLAVGGELGWLRRTSLAFWEDIQFKDFAKAASYHSPDKQSSVDIPYLIQRLFGVRPEQLDIMEYEIVLAEIDSSGLRARVKTRVKVKFLLEGRIEETEFMLFFHRASASDPWFMILEDSLRQLDADKEKKH